MPQQQINEKVVKVQLTQCSSGDGRRKSGRPKIEDTRRLDVGWPRVISQGTAFINHGRQSVIKIWGIGGVSRDAGCI